MARLLAPDRTARRRERAQAGRVSTLLVICCVTVSDALWPVFEDGYEHSLCDEGVALLRSYEDLDAIAEAAGRMPLSAFDEHADVPDDVISQLAEMAQDIPDLSGFPVVWHDPPTLWRPWM